VCTPSPMRRTSKARAPAPASWPCWRASCLSCACSPVHCALQLPPAVRLELATRVGALEQLLRGGEGARVPSPCSLVVRGAVTCLPVLLPLSDGAACRCIAYVIILSLYLGREKREDRRGDESLFRLRAENQQQTQHHRLGKWEVWGGAILSLGVLRA
jgi:hypothetical protein